MVDRRPVIGGVLLAAVLLVVVGIAFYVGVGPAPGSDSGDELTEFPTATPSDGGSTDAGSGTSSTETPPFSFTIDNVEECGQTCRDVTSTLQNNQNETATDVTVFTRLFAGEDNTADEDMVWEGKEEVGSLGGGASYTTTRGVELSLQEARKIDQRDGWITIVTSVQTDDRTVTFRDSQLVG